MYIQCDKYLYVGEKCRQYVSKHGFSTEKQILFCLNKKKNNFYLNVECLKDK